MNNWEMRTKFPLMSATGRRPTQTDADTCMRDHMGLRPCGEGPCPRMSA